MYKSIIFILVFLCIFGSGLSSRSSACMCVHDAAFCVSFTPPGSFKASRLCLGPQSPYFHMCPGVRQLWCTGGKRFGLIWVTLLPVSVLECPGKGPHNLCWAMLLWCSSFPITTPVFLGEKAVLVKSLLRVCVCARVGMCVCVWPCIHVNKHWIQGCCFFSPSNIYRAKT